MNINEVKYVCKKSPRVHSIHGFTLIETLITVSIIAIIMVIAYPIIVDALRKMEAKRVHYTLHNTIKLAKSHSYIHRKRVFMCLTNDTGDCDRNGQKNIVLFFDNNEDNNFDHTVDTLIQDNSLGLKYAKTYLRAGRRHYVRFAQDTGLPRGFFGHFKYCPSYDDDSHMYQLSFNKSGIIRHKPNTIHPTGC